MESAITQQKCRRLRIQGNSAPRRTGDDASGTGSDDLGGLVSCSGLTCSGDRTEKKRKLSCSGFEVGNGVVSEFVILESSAAPDAELPVNYLRGSQPVKVGRTIRDGRSDAFAIQRLLGDRRL